MNKFNIAASAGKLGDPAQRFLSLSNPSVPVNLNFVAIAPRRLYGDRIRNDVTSDLAELERLTPAALALADRLAQQERFLER